MIISISFVSESVSRVQINFGAGLEAQMIQAYESVLKFFKDFNYQVLTGDLKTIAILLSIIFGVMFVLVLFKMRDLITEKVVELEREAAPPAEAVTAYDNRWQEIKSHVNSFKESDWKLGVIEADKFVDDVLKTAGFSGETMGERLMLISPDQLSSLQYLWDAHKLRNLLVHDVNYQVTHRQAILAIEAFENVLKELNALT